MANHRKPVASEDPPVPGPPAFVHHDAEDAPAGAPRLANGHPAVFNAVAAVRTRTRQAMAVVCYAIAAPARPDDGTVNRDWRGSRPAPSCSFDGLDNRVSANNLWVLLPEAPPRPPCATLPR